MHRLLGQSGFCMMFTLIPVMYNPADFHAAFVVDKYENHRIDESKLIFISEVRKKSGARGQRRYSIVLLLYPSVTRSGKFQWELTPLQPSAKNDTPQRLLPQRHPCVTFASCC